MAVLYKQLGAAAGSGTIGTAAQLYAASNSASTSTIISSIVVCNAGSSSQTFSIGVNTATATFAAGKYVVFQAVITANDTIALTLGVVLDPTARFLNVSSSSADVNFSAYGAENT